MHREPEQRGPALRVVDRIRMQASRKHRILRRPVLVADTRPGPMRSKGRHAEQLRVKPVHLQRPRRGELEQDGILRADESWDEWERANFSAR